MKTVEYYHDLYIVPTNSRLLYVMLSYIYIKV